MSKQLYNPHPSYRADIDGLRAIAVLSVIAYHAFPNFVTGGFVGVDIFFVISGYLISIIIFSSIRKGNFGFVDFYIRRINRIFPALILVLITCYVFGWFWLLDDEFKALGKHIASAAVFISNLILWREAGYFDKAAELKPLLHLWSLGIEEQFYLTWPLMLYLAWRRGLNLLRFLIVIAFSSFIINIAMVYSDAVTAFYLPITRFWELLVGCILAYCHIYNVNIVNISPFGAFNDRHICNLKAVVGILFIATAVLLLNKGVAYPGWWALLPTIGTALLISSGADTFINRKMLANRGLV